MLNRLLRAWTQLQEARALRRHPIPDPLWQLTLLRYPFLGQRNAADLADLRRMCSLFLATKEFHGVAGFEISDEVALAVAAQACLPVLRLGLHWYDGFIGIVMHADEVLAQREQIDEDGITHNFEERLAGEAMSGGPLMLTWTSIDADADPAAASTDSIFNLVIHEFAHVIDMRDGQADGMPPLPTRGSQEHWLSVITTTCCASRSCRWPPNARIPRTIRRIARCTRCASWRPSQSSIGWTVWIPTISII